MRPAKVTDEQIIEAGKELQRKSLEVNGWALRNIIGAGKAERLYKVWKRFIGDPKELNEDLEFVAEHVLPTEIDKRLNNFIEVLAKDLKEIVVKSDFEAIKVAENKAKLICSKLEEENQSYKQQLDLASSILEDSDLKIESMRELETQNKAKQEGIVELEKELIKLKTRNEGLESLLAERQALVNEKSNQVVELKNSNEEQKRFIAKVKEMLTAKQLAALESD